MHGPAAGKFDSLGSASLPSAISVILKWPLFMLNDVQYGMYIPAALALGAAYYVGGGLPGGGQSMQTYAMAYGAGGVGYYAGLMVGGNRRVASFEHVTRP